MNSIQIPNMITVGDLADKLDIPVTGLITELMKNGVMATVNERVDFDTAQIIVEELKLEAELVHEPEEAPVKREKKALSKDAQTRPPVVAVMGHVDHGKTSLLDAIRDSSVVKGEAGGITQHISAYQVKRGERLITFLDTPGHEAFAAIREHGAHLTDLVIIVVAADDGVKPQTIEAIRFARKAGVKIVVAINKIDKEGANINRIKQQLAEQELMVEEWGGDVVVQEVSAKTGAGIDELLDMILLVADVEELKADAKGPASGLVIESHMENGRGPVAIALIESGTLKKNDFVVAGETYARVRNLETTEGKPVDQAGPSTPVKITGFRALPEFADEFTVVKDEKTARSQAEATVGQKRLTGSRGQINSSEMIRIIDRSNQVAQFKVIVKADVQGSLTSVLDSLKALDTNEVAVRIVGSGVGAISENDVNQAHSSDAVIYGFGIALPAGMRQIASRDKVSVRLYKVIYELIDDVKTELSARLAPEIKEIELGKLKIKGVFKTTKNSVICGGEVTSGKLTVPAMVRVKRDKEVLAEVEATNLKRGPQDAKEVVEGEMCGTSLTTQSKLEVLEGDVLEFFTRQTVERSL